MIFYGEKEVGEITGLIRIEMRDGLKSYLVERKRFKSHAGGWPSTRPLSNPSLPPHPHKEREREREIDKGISLAADYLKGRFDSKRKLLLDELSACYTYVLAHRYYYYVFKKHLRAIL